MKRALLMTFAVLAVSTAPLAYAKGPKDDGPGGPGRHGPDHGPAGHGPKGGPGPEGRDRHGPEHGGPGHGPDRWDHRGPDHDHHDWSRDWDHNRDDWRGSRAGVIVINQPQYVTLQQRFAPYYREHCPPGQARKGRCGRFNYVIGQPLPPGAPVWAVPAPILATLPPPPPAANYVMVDQNLLLISEGTKSVLDGLVLFSGVR